jgi:hypothetical protein
MWTSVASDVGKSSVSSVSAIAAGTTQLHRPASPMVESGQLPLDPPITLLFQHPQPNLALD